MSLEIWLAYVAATLVLLAIPGPTILTVISYMLAQGRSALVPLLVGVALGDATALALSLIGLGALLSVSAVWFSVVKWIGGLYLIHLGIRQLRSAGSAIAFEQARNNPLPRRSLLRRTWLITALNPKGMVFFIAFLPQFVDTAEPAAPQLWILSVTFVVLATVNALLYALFAGTARQLLSSERAHRHFSLAGGSLLSAAGVWALTVRQA